MKPSSITLLLIVLTLFAFKPAKKLGQDSGKGLSLYENELFSIEVPKGWTCDASQWEGLASYKNEVELYNPVDASLSVLIVKTFFPFHWQNVEEAKEMAKYSMQLSGSEAVLIHEQDGVDVGGYPASMLVYKRQTDGRIYIQKQYVTYLQDSHIVVYFNEFFGLDNWKAAQHLGDSIVGTVRLKRVVNPLEDDSIAKRALQEGIERHPIERKYLENAMKAMEQEK